MSDTPPRKVFFILVLCLVHTEGSYKHQQVDCNLRLRNNLYDCYYLLAGFDRYQ
jgi:hypothetical protein